MSTKIKLALDVIGILISLTGFGLLVADEKYLVGGLLFLIAVVLVIYAIGLSISKPYKVKCISYEYEFLDSVPEKTEVVKTTVFIPQEKNIGAFDDLGIGAEGKIDNVSVKNGTCTIRKAGGAISARTSFDTPLTVGNEYTHEITYIGNRCFPESKENIVHSIIHKMNVAQIMITFHSKKRPSNVKAIHKIGSKKFDITETSLVCKNLQYSLVVRKPKRGSVYEIKWEW